MALDSSRFPLFNLSTQTFAGETLLSIRRNFPENKKILTQFVAVALTAISQGYYAQRSSPH